VDHDRHRYDQGNRTFGAFVVLLVGLGLSLGGVALLVGLVRDVRAFPDAPVPLAFADAVAMVDPPRGTWVSIADAQVDCVQAPAVSTRQVAWALVGQEGSAGQILVHLGSGEAPACEDLKPPFVGVLSRRAAKDLPRLPPWEVDVDDGHATMLWTQQSPPSLASFFVIPLLVVPGLGMLYGVFLVGRERWSRPSPVPGQPLTHVGLAMPLSTGASALYLFTTPMMVLHLVAFGPLFVATRLPGWMVVPLGILWALWFFAVVGQTLKAWTQRASDLLLGHEGLEIRGGPLGATRHDWSQLGEPAARWAMVDGIESTLWIGGEVVATSDHPSEHRSLEAVASTVQHLADQAAGRAVPEVLDRPPHVVLCSACGCPVSPTGEATARCGSCGTEAVMPDGMREQVQAAETFASARQASEALLAELVRQPGPRATNTLMILAIPPLLLGFPLASIVFDEFYQLRGVVSWVDGVALFVGALAFSYGLVGLLRSQVAGRQALRVVAGAFAARPPDREGEPWFCRQCGAPLPQRAGDVVVVGCVHCGAGSIVGIDMLPTAGREQVQAGDLRGELRRRLGARRRYRLVSVASLLWMAGSVAVLWPVWVKLAG